MTRTSQELRCAECGGPVLDALLEELAYYREDAARWLHEQTLGRFGLRLIRERHYAEQSKAAFSLGREIGREEGATEPRRSPVRRVGPRPTHLRAV